MVLIDEFVRKVYERGKITIPKELRDLYGVQDGDMVKLRIVRVVRAAEQLRQSREHGVDVDVQIESDDDSPEVA